MDAELGSIIARAYVRYKRFKPQTELDACTICCITDAQSDALKSMAPRSVPHALLYDYNGAAKPERLDIGEFKHFLPRFLELVAEGRSLSHSIELSFGRFDHFRPEDWDREDVRLLTDYAHAVFRTALGRYPMFPDDPLERIEGMVVLLSKLPIELPPLLDIWLEEPTVDSVRHLSDLFQGGANAQWKFPFAQNHVGQCILAWKERTTFDARFRDILEGMILEQPGTPPWEWLALFESLGVQPRPSGRK